MTTNRTCCSRRAPALYETENNELVARFHADRAAPGLAASHLRAPRMILKLRLSPRTGEMMSNNLPGRGMMAT
eukprot:418825-Lingulodinium_polyedra.AAC.1